MWQILPSPPLLLPAPPYNFEKPNILDSIPDWPIWTPLFILNTGLYNPVVETRFGVTGLYKPVCFYHLQTGLYNPFYKSGSGFNYQIVQANTQIKKFEFRNGQSSI